MRKSAGGLSVGQAFRPASRPPGSPDQPPLKRRRSAEALAKAEGLPDKRFFTGRQAVSQKPRQIEAPSPANPITTATVCVRNVSPGSRLAVVLLFVLSSLATAPANQSTRAGACSEWHQCRRLALAAADRREYETFHDLAWRAVQTGPRNDPDLMYLLARAQALSGRAHDALVMLQRLADMGVAPDAATNDDFRSTRDLPAWPELAARIAGLARSVPLTRAETPAPSAPPPPSPVATAPAPTASASAPISEAIRFSTGRFTVGGLAYDAVSQRFLFADRLGRKLIVVSEGTNRPVDLVRADSAGFQEISAVEIDARRGDLWVASTAPAAATGSLHLLQLVSGRPLKVFPIDADLEPVKLVDLAVTPAGAVLVLDALGGQVLELRPGATSLERVARIDAAEPASIAVEDSERITYVAHRDGLSRIDMQRHTVSPMTAPKTISLARVERIRSYHHALIAVQVDAGGSRRIVRFDLNASGATIIRAATLASSVPTAADTNMTISGDEVVYLAAPSNENSSTTEFVAYRVKIRN